MTGRARGNFYGRSEEEDLLQDDVILEHVELL
jgi:hypothetical protein